MKLSEPKVVTFWIAVVLAALGILANLGTIPALASMAFFWWRPGLFFCSWKFNEGSLAPIRAARRSRHFHPVDDDR